MPKTKKNFFFIPAFLIGAIICEVALWKTNFYPLLVLILSPVLFLATWIEPKFPFLSLTPAINELLLILPINLLYFGLMGYWIHRISRERGILKGIALTLIVILICFIHWQAALGLRELFPSLVQLGLPDDPLH